MGSTGLGWPNPGVPRVRPRGHWLRVVPFLPQILWVGTRHPRLLASLYALEAPAEFGQWVFARLSHRDVELVVLRANWNAGHYTHWSLHALWGRIREGREFLDAVRVGPADPFWDARGSALLRAVDELHDDLAIGPDTLDALVGFGYRDAELTEICFITAHYEMLGMLFESAGMPAEFFVPTPNPGPGPIPRRRRRPARRFDTGLDPRRPCWPGAGHLLGEHRFLRVALWMFGRAAANWATVDSSELATALSRRAGRPQTRDFTSGDHEEAGARCRVLCRAVDELDSEYFLSDDTWVELLRYLTVAQVLELCVLVGHYRFFEMIVNTLEPIELG
ncbi:carboxymuconolactone decarboxylase family protein [Nocardia nepalensis]|uniref:carboxymuconolactone decarboxylase family protein n=1 Tax=Nocardia nepalensis TaxID=3375448 RepID=UPI003B678F4A